MAGRLEAEPFHYSIEGIDIERAVVVGSDLGFLQSLPTDRLLSHTEVRLAAAVLRRLFIDNQLGILLNSIGRLPLAELGILACDLDAVLARWPETRIRYAWAGGAKHANGANHSGLILASAPEQDAQELREFAWLPPEGPIQPMSVKAWLAGTSVAIQTDNLGLVRISRQSLLTYIANRKGGVHFDPSRNLSTHVKRSRQRREMETHLLDHGLLRIGHLSGPEYEVVSMVQAVTGMDWCQEIIRISAEAAPAEYGGDPRDLMFWSGQADDGPPPGWATQRFSAGAESEVDPSGPIEHDARPK